MIIIISRRKKVWGDDKDLGPGEQRHDAFQGAIQAESIEQAFEIAARQNPGKECEVTFPIDPETFFVENSVATFRQLAA
jgi:hypothetical protein